MLQTPNSKIIRITNARSALMLPIAKVFQPQPLLNDVQPTQPNPGKKVPKRQKNPGKEREREVRNTRSRNQKDQKREPRNKFQTRPKVKTTVNKNSDEKAKRTYTVSYPRPS
jgi:hypothetical protein